MTKITSAIVGLSLALGLAGASFASQTPATVSHTAAAGKTHVKRHHHHKKSHAKKAVAATPAK